MVVKLLAGIALLALLWGLLRYALALRYAKIVRERSRAEEEARGRRVVAEIPLDEGLLFFVEDEERFYWGGREARKAAVAGARLLLNGAAISSVAVPGTPLPESASPEIYEGRERWEVVLYLRGGASAVVSCGTLREGVSREIATKVFDAVKSAVGPGKRA
ncbi:MAG TPA: hypothetical protein VGL15_13700 [Vicinamibacteria bacterium]|jgi:hypothetical protein